MNDTNKRLKAAVHSVETPPFLDAVIRQRIHQAEAGRKRGWSLLAATGVAAALVLGVYQLGSVRETAVDQESFIATVSTKVATLMRVGLGDHLHCAFFRKFPSQAPVVEEMESNLGPEYKDLIPVVQQHVPTQYTLSEAHKCRYNGREFVHLTLRNDQQLISLIISAKRDGEAFNVEGMLPELVQSGIPVYSSGAEQFQIAAMETSTHLVYFISDLPGKQNMQLMQSMVASLNVVLKNTKG